MSSSEVEYIVEKVFTSLKDRFLEVEDNIIYADKLFFVKTVVRDTVEKKFRDEIDNATAARILKIVEKYLEGELELVRENGEVKVKLPGSTNKPKTTNTKVKKTTNYDEERKKALDSLREAYRQMILKHRKIPDYVSIHPDLKEEFEKPDGDNEEK